MAEEFEDRDLSDSVFWGVDLRRATFCDMNLSGVLTNPEGTLMTTWAPKEPRRVHRLPPGA